MPRPLDLDTMAYFGRIPKRISIGGANPGDVRIAGEVRRLTYVPDGAEGELIAELCDGTGTMLVHLPRRFTAAWVPGSLVAVEGRLSRRTLVEPRRLRAERFAVLEMDADVPSDWIQVAVMPSSDASWGGSKRRAPARVTTA
jgi:hypothetical protein